MNRVYIKSCRDCGSEYKALGSRSLVCPLCAVCLECRKPVSKPTRDHFCSRSCAGRWNSRNSLAIQAALSTGKGKSKGVVRLSVRDSGNPRWKGGKGHRLASRVEYKAWRKAVLERDNYKCQGCGKKDKLHAHHILPWDEYPDDRFDVDNGLTLCSSCHLAIHRKD